MPCDYRDYHPEWRSIRRQIVEQAGNACEFCGAPNGELIARDGERWQEWDGRDDPEGPRLVMVVLTVAHLDHDRGNNDPANLRALCQRCHLRWDIDLHQRNAAATRRRKRVERGQVEMGVTGDA